MLTGVSTACLYPYETEKSLKLLLESGFRTFEIFLNCESEITDSFLGALSGQLNEYGANVYSVHFYTSGFEPFMFFSNYQRRFDDSVELYRRFCERTARIGARIAVFHGERKNSELPAEEFCARFYILSKMALGEGITLAQENVSRCRTGSVAEIREMRRMLGTDVKFVFDVKQAVRAQESPFDMLDAMGENIVNVHISDNTPLHDCLLPGAGDMDTRKLVNRLSQYGYDGPLIIEVYSSDFENMEELSASKRFTQAFLDEK